jgi:RNA polymerase sigma-B factor
VVQTVQRPAPIEGDEPRADLTAELLADAAAAPEGERLRLQDRAIELNLPIARSIARRFGERGQPLDDLEQAASIGLIKAVRRFEVGQGVDFLAYAVPTIAGEVKRHFRDSGWTVRPPRRIQEAQARVGAAGEELTAELGRSPTTSEVAAHLDLDEETVIEALSSRGCFTPTSLDAPLDDDDGTGLGQLLGVEDDGFALAEARLSLEPAIDELRPRDRLILELRVAQGRTQSEIAAELGISQMQVSRLLTRIRETLRPSLD